MSQNILHSVNQILLFNMKLPTNEKGKVNVTLVHWWRNGSRLDHQAIAFLATKGTSSLQN